jgi:uncharacterized OB-fold protein
MSDQPEHARPLPLMQGLARQFYDWCGRGELRFQRCSACGAWRHVPREMCARCGSFDWSWGASAGKGRVFTWTVVARPMHPAFQHDVPYAVVVVEMDEGVRLASTVVDCTPGELEIDMPVEVVFDTVDGVTLPRFRRADAARRRRRRRADD